MNIAHHRLQKLAGQKGLTIWLYGLSGAGKTTIALLLEQMLTENNLFCIRLDGDEMREGINKGLGFTDEDRAENVRRASEIAKLHINNNVITICSFITPLNAHRNIFRNMLGENVLEVFVDCPLQVCEQRDVKGLYKKAAAQQIKTFTGYDSSFEKPDRTVMTLNTHILQAEHCTNMIYEQLLDRIYSTSAILQTKLPLVRNGLL
jgi:adenylylsulfate kinase